MFTDILTKIGNSQIIHQNQNTPTRRQHLRHADARADMLIAGKAYPVADWSLGGAMFETPRADWNIGGAYFEDAPVPELKNGDIIVMAMRFYVMGEVLDIPMTGTVLRKTAGRTVVKFAPLSHITRRAFDRVTDLLNTRDFLRSQTQTPTTRSLHA